MTTDIVSQEPQIFHQPRKSNMTEDKLVIAAKANGTVADCSLLQRLAGNSFTFLSRLITITPIVPMESYYESKGESQHSSDGGTCYARIHVCPCFHYDISIHLMESQIVQELNTSPLKRGCDEMANQCSIINL